MERCWNQDPNKRPSFEEIVYELKTDPRFITDTINKEEFFEYVDYIDKSVRNIKMENPTFQKITLSKYEKKKAQQKLQFSINMETVDLKKFDKESQVGKGGFGTVYKVIEKETGDAFAAKVSIYEMNECSYDMIMNISREVEIVSQLNHPAIMKFIGYNPNNFKFKPKPTIVTEFLSNSSLDRIIELERMNCGVADWDDTKKLINIYGIAVGMKYIHSHDILHRDLKPANILLDEFLYPKIADFGLSKDLNLSNNSDSKFAKSGFKGTYLYSAPEILNEENYTKAGDVYAFAMIVYEIVTNEIPFQGLNQFQLLKQISNEQRPTFQYPIPYCYRKLIKKCWSQDPANRPTFDEIASAIEEQPAFITENVDKEEFLDYVAYVKEFEFEPKANNKKPVSVELNNDQNKNDTQLNNKFLDLDLFDKINLISKDGVSKVYKIQEKESTNFYVARILINEIGKFSEEETQKLIQEITVISQLNHPSFLKFIGFSPIDFSKKFHPVVVTELSTNGTLEQILESCRNKEQITGWNDTKKLIVIYGIASGMSCLHSHEILHRDLNSSNVFLDDYLFPKIGDFGLLTRFNKVEKFTSQSTAGIKRIPFYSAPEVLQSNQFSKSSDVYAFSFIVYEIIADQIPFEDLSCNQIFNQVVIKKKRPELERPVYKEQIPDAYKRLIEKCWSDQPEERPSFDEIVHLLRSEKGFLLNTISQESFYDYVNFIDESRVGFDEFISSKIKETDENEQVKIIEE